MQKKVPLMYNIAGMKWTSQRNILADCNLTGKIKLPSFSKLETVVISGNPGLKAIDAGKNPSLTTLRCAGCSPSDFETDKVKFTSINKLSVRKCRNLKYLYAGWNNIKSIDVSNNKGTGTVIISGRIINYKS